MPTHLELKHSRTDSPPSAFRGFRCRAAGHFSDQAAAGQGCMRCAADGESVSLTASYDNDQALENWKRRAGSGLWRYAGLLPITTPQARVHLGEGSTPLLGPYTNDQLGRVWLKNESANPTFSFKDRLAAVGVSAAAQSRASTIIASSTGNHGIAVAAYASAAGIPAVVLIRPETNATTVHYLRSLGAEVVTTTPPGRWALIEQAVNELGWYPLTSYSKEAFGNPYAIEGHKSIAFELFEELGRVPEVVLIPTCYGEAVSGIAAGFRQLKDLGLVDHVARIVAIEPAGGGPLTQAVDRGLDRMEPVEPYTTVAASIGATAASDRALAAIKDSQGTAVRVTDDQMLQAQARLARMGLFVETAAAAGFAALELWPDIQARLEDPSPHPDQDVVILLTAGGLRTWETSDDGSPTEPPPFITPDSNSSTALQALVAR